MQYSEQSINNVIQVKQYVNAIRPIYEALTGAKSVLLHTVRDVWLPTLLTLNTVIDPIVV